MRRLGITIRMSELPERLRQTIEQRGVISFAEYMERALYDPSGGYYRSSRAIGRRGDFFTSVSAGSFFGELLAFQFVHWFQSESKRNSFQIVESGAHDGRLARDILTSLGKHHRDAARTI